MCILISSEGTNFQVRNDLAKKSILLYEMLIEDEGNEEACIPLPNVESDVLGKVIDFFNILVEHEFPAIEKPIKSIHMEDIVPPVYKTYIELEIDMVFKLLEAANYLHIEQLIDLACAKIATMIRGRTPEQIREIFHITGEPMDHDSANTW